MIRYYVTNRRQGDIVAHATRAIASGVEMIQVREKDLPGAELFELVMRIRRLASGTATKILVNDRLDIALATGVDGVHLPSDGLPPDRVRPFVRIMGVSTHSVDDAIAAEQANADFIVFGPVFDTPGKNAVGLELLRNVVASVRIPVLGIGGIKAADIDAVMDTGAAGIAAIRMFQME